jgi:NADPH:quinone reductase
MTAPQTMRALFVETENGPFIQRDIPRPQPEAGQVLVNIKASSINPLDLKIRSGQALHAKQPLPTILGLDLAGIVEAVGADVTGFQPGDAVYGMAGGAAGLQGTLAEYAAVDARLLCKKPAKLTMPQAAAVPLVFITAWEGLVDRACLKTGQTVLIHAGAGGVGHMAVQLAVALGADVYATVSPGKKHIVEGYGATPIDYQTTSVAEAVAQYTGGQGFDVIYDTVGNDALEQSLQAVRSYGHIVSCLGRGTHSLAQLSLCGASYSGVFTLLPMLTGHGRTHHGDILREASRLVEAGQLQPLLHSQAFSFETAQDAYTLFESGKATGKVVISLE